MLSCSQKGHYLLYYFSVESPCSASGNRLDIGFGCCFFAALAYVKVMNPAKLTAIPRTPRNVIEFPKTMLVTTIAKMRRIQFKAA